MAKKRKQSQSATPQLISPYKTLLLKLALLVLSVSVIGLPMNSYFDLILLIVVVLFLLTNTITQAVKKWAYAIGVVVVIRLFLWWIPDLNIQEGGNYFTYVNQDEVLEQTLPPRVFNLGKRMLQAQYPQTGKACADKDYCWGSQQYPDKKYPGPEQTYGFSADGLWQSPKYSRIVNHIDFFNQTTHRVDFLNTSRINWVDWFKDPKKRAIIPRHKVPYFIVYEFPPNALGGTLCVQGYFDWQGRGQFHAKNERCIVLNKNDIKVPIYGFSIVHSQPLAMHFDPPKQVKVLDTLQTLLKIIALAAVLFLLLRKNWLDLKGWHYFGALAGGALVVAYALFTNDSFSQLLFAVHQAGNDGLNYVSKARVMLLALFTGDITEFLRGGADVFYYMPGLRYMRTIEMLLFGSANFGYLLLLLFFVLFLFKLLQHFLGWRTALPLIALFVLTPWLEVFGFAFDFYYKIMVSGFPGTAAYTFLIIGLYLVFKYVNTHDTFTIFGFWAGLSFALAVFIRPNLALMLAVFLMGILIVLIRQKRIKSLLIFCGGFSPILLVPLHNFYFGSELVLLTSAAFIPANFITSPEIYWQALTDFINGESTQATKHVLFRWFWWAEGKYQFFIREQIFSAHINIALHLLVVVLAMFGLFYKKLKLPPLFNYLIVAVIIQHLSLFMWHAAYRYAFIVWLLTFFIAAVVVKHGIVLFYQQKQR